MSRSARTQPGGFFNALGACSHLTGRYDKCLCNYDMNVDVIVWSQGCHCTSSIRIYLGGQPTLFHCVPASRKLWSLSNAEHGGQSLLFKPLGCHSLEPLPSTQTMCPRGLSQRCHIAKRVHEAYTTHSILTIHALTRHSSYVCMHFCIRFFV